MIKPSGKLLTPEQSARLAVATRFGRDRILKGIVAEMQKKAKLAERREPKR
jgi:hypothetical protein